MTKPHASETVIVGAGLSGLALAHHLVRAGRDVVVLEARDRIGGRVLAGRSPSGATYDLGPAWIWPHNRRMLALAQTLGLDLFEQYAEGRLVYEEASGNIRRDLDFAPMAGSLRVAGGLSRLTDALAAEVQSSRIRTSHAVRSVDTTGDSVVLVTSSDVGDMELRAERVVFALPPRLVAETISFTPPLPASIAQAMAAVPTWMAGHAKLIAIYEEPFWRAQGLSGDAMSQRGPLAEIHDASPIDGPEGALFGFVGTPPAARQEASEVQDAALAQLERLFGPHAAEPTALLWADWAQEPATATRADWQPLAGHPAYGPLPAMAEMDDQRILFCGTELAPEDGGFLEGALSAAEGAYKRLTS